MTTHGHDNRMRHPTKPAILSLPGSPSSAACSRRRSTTCIHAGVDSSLRWNDDGGHKTRTGNLKCHSAPARHSGLSAAGRRRPESSGFNKSFPQRGNDNTRARQSNAPSAKLAIPSLPRPALLDSSLRWNDDGGHKTRTGNLKCHSAPARHSGLSAAGRRRPESSGFNKPFPQSGNDNLAIATPRQL